jgi:hypothetical protein
MRYIEHVEIDFQHRSLNFVQLCINAHPARFRAIPVFTDPMVIKAARSKIGAETATPPGRHTLGTQHGDEKHRKVTTDTDEAFIDRPSGGKRLAVMGEEAIQHPLYRANMGLTFALVRKRNAVGGGRMLMQQQALYDADESG